MNFTRPIVAPVSSLVAGDALSTAAVAHHSPAALLRGGPVHRAANLHARGVSRSEAAAMAAKQGKGHVAELLQSVHYSARAGVLGRQFHARPNPRANDPLVDIQLRRRGARGVAGGAQVKVGSLRYVLRAARFGGYQILVANFEATEAIERDYGFELDDRLGFGGNEAAQLSAEDCEERAAESIERILSEELPFGRADQMVLYARAGCRAALESVAFGMLRDLVHGVWTGQAVDLAVSVRNAARSAGRSAARAVVQSHLLVDQFMARARQQFSDRLLHRIAGSAVVLGAVAEVVVETAIDVVKVLRNEMTFDELLRSFGVHVCTAAGGALGMLAAGALTGGAAWWVQALAMVVGGALGAQGGRQIGTALFQPAALPAGPLPAR